MLSPIVRDAQRQRCWKRGSGDGQRLSLYDFEFGTTERSFSAVERWGSTLTWTVCMAADSEERQICTTCLPAEGVGLWRNDGLMLSPIVEHTSVWEGVGGWGEIWRGIPQWNTKASCQNHKQQLLRPRSGPRKAAPEQPGRKISIKKVTKYWANIEKRNQINTKNYWK